MTEICPVREEFQRSSGVPVGEGKVVAIRVTDIYGIPLTSFPNAHLFSFPAPCLLLLSQGSGVGEANKIQ